MKAPKTPEDTEEFLALLDELRQMHVIVEGKKDRLALKSLGVNNVSEISGKPLSAVVRMIAAAGQKRVVILTDFDAAGKRLAQRLCVLLQAKKIHPDRTMRLNMKALGKTRIEDFKAIGHERNNRGDTYGEISANIDQVYYQGKHQGKGSRRKT